MGKNIIDRMRTQLLEAARIEWQMTTPRRGAPRWEAFRDGYLLGAAFTIAALSERGLLKDIEGGDALAFDAERLARPREREYVAHCEACRHTMPEAEYVQAERAAGPHADPACPGCGRRAWTFHSVS